jgi:hypothetical protein
VERDTEKLRRIAAEKQQLTAWIFDGRTGEIPRPVYPEELLQVGF